MLRNDVLCHERTVQAVNEAAQGLLLCSMGHSKEGLQHSLHQLNQRWDLVRSETETRQLQLENNLSQVLALPAVVLLMPALCILVLLVPVLLVLRPHTASAGAAGPNAAAVLLQC